MPKFGKEKDSKLDIRMSLEQVLAIEARAFMSGVNRCDFVRNMIEKSWATRLAKPHRAYVPMASVLLEISAKIGSLVQKDSLSDVDRQTLHSNLEKLNEVLLKLTQRVAQDQLENIDDSDTETDFE